MFGLLNINKPAGRSSRWVVDHVSRLIGVKKIGHAGTLDPLATGVLVLALGPATRLVDYLQAGTKVYRAEITLGTTTSTYDAEGEITGRAPVPTLTTAAWRELLNQFEGTIEQTPPIYSAIKIDGVAAYRRARRGQPVEIASRPVTIKHIQVLDWESPRLTVEVVCAAGTYIRSLAHDLGAVVGCGGYLSSLVRLASGQFRIEDGVDLDRLASAVQAGTWQDLVLPPDQAVLDLVPVTFTAAETDTIQHGNPVSCPQKPATAEGRAYGPQGRFFAVVRYDAAQNAWRPAKVFLTTL